ncbi:hypothetical protein GCK72_013926 [Caenorhabditis remanei]|uniref:Uncharacterized protein n=2 Tax=Caenorhabditis remanei TaxID=31234 RepID=E3M7A7_CAERE|nr:hypothetical protein GCK72_013926 [Caenorhabditis remanei]EFO93883.1 hypothetical protein CRE_12690 [Caenorhabditis remanei]KAF1757470.1 hypothetical protein GCK72_013926 [Caenorhabditis remanei]
MQFFSTCFLALLAVCAVSAQFLPFYPADHYEPSIFYKPPQVEEPGLFNFIPNAGNVHTINRPPTPLGWGRK